MNIFNFLQTLLLLRISRSRCSIIKSTTPLSTITEPLCAHAVFLFTPKIESQLAEAKKRVCETKADWFQLLCAVIQMRSSLRRFSKTLGSEKNRRPSELSVPKAATRMRAQLRKIPRLENICSDQRSTKKRSGQRQCNALHCSAID